MHKKLMAAAVAGALAAPVSALAATANVDIYGYFNVEYGFVSQPDGPTAGTERESADAFNSGASRIGFRSRENLGGGLTAWAQCESQLVFVSTGNTGAAWCNRNTAIGLQGSFGNIFVGRWDSAYKRVNGATRMLNEAGWTGAANLMVQGVTPNGDEMDFSNRNTHSINWDSPNWNGFRIMVQTTSTNAALDAPSSGPEVKGRRTSAGALYSSGPFVIGVGVDKKDDNAADTAPGNGAKDSGLVVGGTYRMGMWKFGLTYNDLEAEDGAGGTLEKTSYNIAVDYDLAGPGLIRAGYTWADEWEGTAGTPDSGGSQLQVGYKHSFSKRTTGGLIVAKVDNDDNGVYNFTNLDVSAPGESGTVVVLQLTHTF